MKTKLSVIFTLALSFNLYAADLPKEVSVHLNKQGTLTTTYNGKVKEDESQIDCKIKHGPYTDESVRIEAHVYEYPLFSFEKDETDINERFTKTVNGKTTTFTKYSGNATGATAQSYCGKFARIVKNITSTLIVNEDSLTIISSYKCGMSFSSNKTTSICKFEK